MLDRQNHAAGGANSSVMVGMFVCLCFTSKKPSEREFVVPAGADLGVKLLNSCGREYGSTFILIPPQTYPQIWKSWLKS